MKCQHCGINFEDGERFCPICGERAGSKGRLSETGKMKNAQEIQEEARRNSWEIT